MFKKVSAMSVKLHFWHSLLSMLIIAKFVSRSWFMDILRCVFINFRLLKERSHDGTDTAIVRRILNAACKLVFTTIFTHAYLSVYRDLGAFLE